MDREYWDKYYARKRRAGNVVPSSFAKYVWEHVISKANWNIGRISLIELGCGNGRDAIYFANEGLNVHAVDQCKGEIEALIQKTNNLANIFFRCADFSSLEDAIYDVVYSRFTLHSISAYQQKRVLQWAFRNLAPGGYLCIEVRGQKNELYQKGKLVEGETDAYIWNNHYRRFLHFEGLCRDLMSLGFVIMESAEEKDFAPYNGENETYIRVIAHKI
jgi:tellurite methyltransferase